MSTVAITPHPTRKSTCVTKSPGRLGDILPYSPQKNSVPTHKLISTISTPPNCGNISSSLEDDMAAECSTNLKQDLNSLKKSSEEEFII